MSPGVGTLLAAGIGCVLNASQTQVEASADGFQDRTRAEFVANEGCRSIDVLLPPGARWRGGEAKVRFGDGGRSRLSDTRWEHLPRDSDGYARVRLHAPELLMGDRLEIDVQRSLSATSYDWTPGEEGARFAEIRLPKNTGWTVDAFQVEPDRRGYWVASPTPGAAVRIWSSAEVREADVAWSLGHPGLDLPPPGPSEAQPATSPAEATSAVSRFRLLPDRADWGPIELPGAISIRDSAILLSVTADMALAAIIDAERPSRPVGIVPTTRSDGDIAPRIWAHPDATWRPSWSVLTATGPVSPVGAPAGSGPGLDDPIVVERLLRLTLPAGRDPRAALVPGEGSEAHIEDEIRFGSTAGIGVRAHLLTAPIGMVLSEPPEVDGAGDVLTASTGDQVLLMAPAGAPTRFSVSWVGPDAPTCGPPPPAGVSRSIVASGGLLREDANGWLLHAWDQVPLATDRDRVIAGLQARFNRRSLPEPGMPMRLRGRLRGWDLAAELVETLRDRAVIAELPGQDPLWPRRLYAARKSGVVSPFEAALIVRIYALQAKIESDWVLVRPHGAPDAPELCAPTYDAMLVRLRLDGEERWLDPACAACAPFEVRPELSGRPALGRDATATPAGPEGRFDIEIDGPDVAWSLEGPAALELRRWLRQRPVKGRANALAQRMAGPGATLMSVEGATELGVPIRAKATAARVDAIPDPGSHLLPETDGVLTWSGPRSLRQGSGEAAVVNLQAGPWSMELEIASREGLGL